MVVFEANVLFFMTLIQIILYYCPTSILINTLETRESHSHSDPSIMRDTIILFSTGIVETRSIILHPNAQMSHFACPRKRRSGLHCRVYNCCIFVVDCGVDCGLTYPCLPVLAMMCLDLEPWFVISTYNDRAATVPNLFSNVLHFHSESRTMESSVVAVPMRQNAWQAISKKHEYSEYHRL
jgi:hypothetical protein